VQNVAAFFFVSLQPRDMTLVKIEDALCSQDAALSHQYAPVACYVT
jgi:hypothetical protein